MVKCLNCGNWTENPKFCSRSCSISYSNHKKPKRQVDKTTGVCLKCGATFEYKHKKDGGYKYRKFCGNCPPFNVICKKCGRNYEYDKNNRRGHKKDTCNSCTANVSRHAKREEIIERLGGKCSVCGYSKCQDALQFHHKDPSLKKFDLSIIGMCRKMKDVIVEADKCVLLCANCHAELHAN